MLPDWAQPCLHRRLEDGVPDMVVLWDALPSNGAGDGVIPMVSLITWQAGIGHSFWTLKIGKPSLYLMAVMNSVLLSWSPRVSLGTALSQCLVSKAAWKVENCLFKLSLTLFILLQVDKAPTCCIFSNLLTCEHLWNPPYIPYMCRCWRTLHWWRYWR